MADSTLIAVLMTCHNRRDSTLRCLGRLERQRLGSAAAINVILVDDGSTDGTASAVRERHPDVTVLEGDGSLYWNGGMRRAFERAMEMDPNYYLLLNDDTFLFDHAISQMIAEHRGLRRSRNRPIVVVGSTCDPETGNVTYGGWKTEKWWNPLHTEIVDPSDRPQRCDTFNANCTLVGERVVALVGNLDSSFTHGFGDYDYGFRVNENGGEVWVASGFQGECARDHGTRPWYNPERSWRERIDDLRDVRAEPLKERMIYARRHGGLLWVVPWLFPYLRVTLDYLLPGFFRPHSRPGARSTSSSLSS
jgi:GT2 family glycosyltransferase